MAQDGHDWKPGELVRNMGEPFYLKEVNVHGVSAEACKDGEKVSIWVRIVLTSDEPHFHRVVENLVAVIEASATASECPVHLRSAQTILLVIHADNSAELWVDRAALATYGMMKRDMPSGSVVFESDVADVTGMDFPLVKIADSDRVVCIFRQDWRFALFFDFNPDNKFDREAMRRSLGDLYRTLRYRHLYEIVSDDSLLATLTTSGWFPFVEIISEIRPIADAASAGFEITDAERILVARFDQARLERMFARWITKSHFAGKETLLRAALNTYLGGEPAAVIKIALTEIEGILTAFYRAAHGRGARLKKLLAFALDSAERKAGSPNTLLFPAAFGRYLNEHTFADFDPSGPPGHAGSRHAVGHGAADAASYTNVRALQALLTLDQLSFYT
jgi:hypothetical protein